MKLAFLRYLVGDAGNIQRLYWAVKSAAESATDDVKKQWAVFLRLYGKSSGLASLRSAEPHFSLARELNFLEWRSRWRVTNGPGKALLALWDNENPPKYLILGQLITYDHSFLIPFLRRLVEKQPQDSELVKVASKITKEVWLNLSARYKLEFVSIEPPLPLNPKDRTCDHHARARLRLLLGFPNNEGLNLTWQQISKVTEEFNEFDNDWPPSDYYFRLGRVLGGRKPEKISHEKLLKNNLDAFRVLKGFTYASVKGAFHYINEKALPNCAVDWNQYLTVIRKDASLSFHQGFFRDDFLFTIKEEGTKSASRTD